MERSPAKITLAESIYERIRRDIITNQLKPGEKINIRELCARYFTYMSRDSGAHFVLFDDAQTMAKKVEIARQLSIPTILGAWSDLQDAVPALGLSSSFPSRSQILR